MVLQASAKSKTFWLGVSELQNKKRVFHHMLETKRMEISESVFIPYDV